MPRILIWSPNFAPEYMGIPPLVTDAANWLTETGHHVDVITALPNYPERVIAEDYRRVLYMSEVRDGVDVHRSWLHVRQRERVVDKLLYEASFATVSLPRVLKRLRPCDVIVCVVPSLVAATYAAAAVAVLRGVRSAPRFVIWVQDLVLAAAASVGGEGRHQAVFRLLRGIEGQVIGTADCVVTCSPGFREYLVARGVNPSSIVTVLNWVDTNEYVMSLPLDGEGGATRFLYAGNVGYTQGLETLVDAARLVPDIARVRIVGDGNAATALRAYAANVGNVSVEASVPREMAPGLLSEADAHIVIQRRVSAGVNLPSKIATCLSSGRPILASIDQETPAAHILRASGGAILVEPENPVSLADAMRRLHADVNLRHRLAARGREYAERRLGHSASLERLSSAILG